MSNSFCFQDNCSTIILNLTYGICHKFRNPSRELNWINLSGPFKPENAQKSKWCANLPENSAFVKDFYVGLPGHILPRNT